MKLTEKPYLLSGYVLISPRNALMHKIYTNDNNDQDNNKYHLHYYYHLFVYQ